MTPRSISSGDSMIWAVRLFEALLVIFCLVGAWWLNAQRPIPGKHVDSKSLIGKSAPQFVVSTLDGKVVSLADYRGRPLLVNFWATWCGNCKIEMPWLGQLREKYRSQGFEVLGIVTGNAPPEKISALTQKYGVRYPVLLCNHATAQAYGGLPDLPESFFIDKHGRIVAVMDGADSKQEIETNIRRVLGLGSH